MSFIDEYINKKIKQNPKLEKEFAQADHDLKAAVMTKNGQKVLYAILIHLVKHQDFIG